MRSLFIMSGLAMALLVAGCIQPQTAPANQSERSLQATAAWKPDGIISAGEYSHWSSLGRSPGKNLTLYWRNDASELYMAIEGQTDGWEAVGFEPSDWMKDADMVVGSVSGENVTVQDQNCTGNYGPHLRDEELGGTSDIQAYGGKVEGGYTIIEFQRKMDTGDRFDKAFIPGQSVPIIWAMASSSSLGVKHDLADGKGVMDLD
jgi:hypothetical protein